MSHEVVPVGDHYILKEWGFLYLLIFNLSCDVQPGARGPTDAVAKSAITRIADYIDIIEFRWKLLRTRDFSGTRNF